MKQLKRGEIAVDKKRFFRHLHLMHKVINYVDALFEQQPSFERGAKISKAINTINFSLHEIEHFDLNVPLDKLGKELPEKYKR